MEGKIYKNVCNIIKKKMKTRYYTPIPNGP